MSSEQLSGCDEIAKLNNMFTTMVEMLCIVVGWPVLDCHAQIMKSHRGLFLLTGLFSLIVACASIGSRAPAAVPSYCNDQVNAGAAACVGAKPDWCLSDSNFFDTGACFGSKPDVCKSDTAQFNSVACLGYHPEACRKDSNQLDTLACFHSRPDMCRTSTEYMNRLACVGSHPDYCSTDSSTLNSLACLGSKPTACSQSENANTLACLDFKFADESDLNQLARLCSMTRHAILCAATKKLSL